jgi:hypothetical protein
MDPRYDMFCLADPLYYEPPERLDDDGRPFAVHLPPGWTTAARGSWIQVSPPRLALPSQGWKVHVSATLDGAAEILKAVSEHCLTRGLAFKHLASMTVLAAHNSKYAPRDASGKFITLYPRDDAELADALHRLDDAIGGRPGPHILSDLKWREGPLYVRYGGFDERWVFDAEGRRLLAIAMPDGTLVPDQRLPYPDVPAWAPVPDVLRPVLAEWESEPEESFPYEVREALHFSNGGGVYLAHDPAQGVDVVLKEGRPHAGLDARGRDAVQRLATEAAMLRRLDGVPGVPRLIGEESLGGHRFLVLEAVPGQSLSSWTAQRYPYLAGAVDPPTAAAYEADVACIVERLRGIVDAIHGRGICFGDLHPGNVMVGPDLAVSLIDFEVAEDLDAPAGRALGAPGFAAPSGVSGREADRYSLAAIELYLRTPATTVLCVAPAKVSDVAAHARENFALPADVADAVVARLGAPRPDAPALRAPRPAWRFAAGTDWTAHTAAMVDAIHASAEPDRTDRLFPADINVFLFDGTGLAFGAAGVVDTLAARADAGPLNAYVAWLLDAARRAPGTGPAGLYDGLAGVSWALRNLGRVADADELLDASLARRPETVGVKLFDGLAGIGLVALDAYRRTGSPAYGAAATRIVEEVRATVERGRLALPQAVESVTEEAAVGNAVEGFSAGLLYGWSGLALLLVRAYEVWGEESLLAAAVTALRHDLVRCELTPDGTLEVLQGSRVLPYVATGGAGIALVLDLVLGHVEEADLRTALVPLATPAASAICVCGGLFNGRAGLVWTLHELRSRLPWDDIDERIRRGVAALDLLAVETDSGLVFPGEQNLRLSMDLATGSAGVLRVLDRLGGGTADVLPFLSRPAWRTHNAIERR